MIELKYIYPVIPKLVINNYCLVMISPNSYVGNHINKIKPVARLKLPEVKSLNSTSKQHRHYINLA